MIHDMQSDSGQMIVRRGMVIPIRRGRNRCVVIPDRRVVSSPPQTHWMRDDSLYYANMSCIGFDWISKGGHTCLQGLLSLR